MKKNFAVIIFAIVLILIAAFLYFNQSVAPKAAQDAPSDKGNIFTSIKDAMSKSLSLKCEYETVDAKTTAYIKGNMVRVESKSTDEKTKNSNVIMKDNNMWIWTEGEKTGLLIELKNEEIGTEEADMSTGTDQQEVIEDLERYKDRCVAAAVSDSMFTPPVDIKFNSLSQLQESMMNQINISGVPLEVEE